VGSAVIQVQCGYASSYFLLNNGDLYACGSNQYDQLGLLKGDNDEDKGSQDSDDEEGKEEDMADKQKEEDKDDEIYPAGLKQKLQAM